MYGFPGIDWAAFVSQSCLLQVQLQTGSGTARIIGLKPKIFLTGAFDVASQHLGKSVLSECLHSS